MSLRGIQAQCYPILPSLLYVSSNSRTVFVGVSRSIAIDPLVWFFVTYIRLCRLLMYVIKHKKIRMETSNMKTSISTLLIIILSLSSLSFSQPKLDSDKSKLIRRSLTEIVNDGDAPGMIAAIISSEGVIAIGSAGVRKAGSDILITTDDIVHLGSCSKAMTAAMLATLVAEGKLSWESKLIDVNFELKESIHSDYHQITLWQLITHRAGIPKNPASWSVHAQKDIKARRLAILEDNLQGPAKYKYGEFHYSNIGYMIAACMAEKVTGTSWESLMKKRLFDPLGMSSAGFGPPNTHNQIDQPWGHSWEFSLFGNNWQPDQSDNPEALGPAGRVHCNIGDWAKFLSLFLLDENPVLDSKYLDKLTTPVGYYAGGWGVAEQAEQPWAKGKALSHGGSNGIWYTFVIVAPKIHRIYIVATNSREFGSTARVCNDMISKLVKMDLNR